MASRRRHSKLVICKSACALLASGTEATVCPEDAACTCGGLKEKVDAHIRRTRAQGQSILMVRADVCSSGASPTTGSAAAEEGGGDDDARRSMPAILCTYTDNPDPKPGKDAGRLRKFADNVTILLKKKAGGDTEGVGHPTPLVDDTQDGGELNQFLVLELVARLYCQLNTQCCVCRLCTPTAVQVREFPGDKSSLLCFHTTDPPLLGPSLARSSEGCTDDTANRLLGMYAGFDTANAAMTTKEAKDLNKQMSDATAGQLKAGTSQLKTVRLTGHATTTACAALIIEASTAPGLRPLVSFVPKMTHETRAAKKHAQEHGLSCMESGDVAFSAEIAVAKMLAGALESAPTSGKSVWALLMAGAIEQPIGTNFEPTSMELKEIIAFLRAGNPRDLAKAAARISRTRIRQAGGAAADDGKAGAHRTEHHQRNAAVADGQSCLLRRGRRRPYSQRQQPAHRIRRLRGRRGRRNA